MWQKLDLPFSGQASVTPAVSSSVPCVAPVFPNALRSVKMPSGQIFIVYTPLFSLCDVLITLIARYGKCDPTCDQFADICGPCVEKTTVRPTAPPTAPPSGYLPPPGNDFTGMEHFV